MDCGGKDETKQYTCIQTNVRAVEIIIIGFSALGIRITNSILRENDSYTFLRDI